MKRRINFVLAVLVVFLFGGAVSTVFANTYYVATNGSDYNPGTFDEPWQTIARSTWTTGPGDTVYIRGGTYYETVTIVPNSGNAVDGYLTFQNYQDETVILDGTFAGSTTNVLYLAGKSYIRVIGFRIVNYVLGINLNAGTGDTPPGADHIEMRHCYIDVGDPVANRGDAINVKKGHDLIFADLEIYDCKKGILVSGGGYGTAKEAYNVQILDVYSHDHWNSEGDGVSIGDYSHDILISGCETHDTNDDGIDVRGYNITIENCIAYNCTYPDSDAHGIKCYGIDPCDGSVPDYYVRVIKCLSYNNYRGMFLSALGHSVFPSTRPSFRSKEIEVINCTVANNTDGIVMDTTYDNYPLFPYIQNTIATSTTDVNALYYLPNISDTNTFIPILTADYNLWWTDISGLGPINQDGTYYSSYLIENPDDPNSWYLATGNDANSRSVDPNFVDVDSNDFELDSVSVCIDAGTDVNLPYAGSAPDMGVFESGTIEVNCPANYLTTGENWISIPVAADNAQPYSVFDDLGYWPNCVYHNLYRYNSPTAGFVEYPTYQSDAVQFGKIVPGGAYKLMLGGNQSTIYVSGIKTKGTQTLTIGGSGTRTFYFGDPFNKTISKSFCWIRNGTTEVSIDEAIANGWIGNVQHFNPGTKSWEAIGSTLEKWHAYRLTANTAGELQLIIYDLDFDDDVDVDLSDMGLMAENWLDSNCSNKPVGALDGDCDVDFIDYAIFSRSWGQ